MSKNLYNKVQRGSTIYIIYWMCMLLFPNNAFGPR